jgi:iron(III) transport system ATP-binding protein
MSNRLVCEHSDGSWACEGQVFGGAPLQVSPLGGVVAARLRSVDIHLHPMSVAPPADHTTAKVVVVDAEYGGRHMDIVVRLGDTRLLARVSTDEHGGWARKLGAGDPVLVSFRPSDAMLYEAESERTVHAGVIDDAPRSAEASPHAVGV